MGEIADHSKSRPRSMRRLHPLLAAVCLIPWLGFMAAPSMAAPSQWRCITGDNGKWQCQPAASHPGEQSTSPAATVPPLLRAKATTPAPPPTATDLDWYPRSALTSQQRQQIPAYCPGMYIEPANDSPSAGTRFDIAPIQGSANDSQVIPNQRAVLVGDVHLTRGNLRLTADRAVVDFAAEQITLDGHIVVRDSGKLVRGQHAVISTKDGSGTMDDAYYVFYDANTRGKAAHITRVNDDVSTLRRASYTRCPPSDQSWQLRARDVKINRATGIGTAKGAVLRLAGVPVFYVPYMTFPIDNRRRSGFLWPTIASARGTGGIDLTVPYYWNIAPNADATIAPRYIKGRGLDTELEVRHLSRHSNLVASGAYLDDRDTGDDRWLVGVKERGDFGPGWYHAIDYTRVSDDDYFSDLGAKSLEVQRQSHLLEQAAVGYFGANWTFNTRVRRYQTIDDDVINPYQLMPQIDLSKHWSQRPFHPDWMLYAQATQFDISMNNRPRGSRLYLEPGISLPMEWAWGFLRPTIKAKGVAYDLDANRPTPGNDDQPSAVAPLASVDAGLYFDRSTKLFGTRYTQTLEPRVYYLYVQPKDQTDLPNFDTQLLSFDYYQLWRESRFSGYDRIADTNQVSVGLTSRLIDNTTGVQTLSASIGQIFYFGNRDVTLGNRVGSEELRGHSDVAGDLSWRWTRHLLALANASYDQTTNQLDNAGIQLRYWNPGHLTLNIGQHYRRQPERLLNGRVIDNDINQSDISAIVPVADHWALIGRWNYDYNTNRNLEQLVGVEYNSCCWRFRVLYQAGVDGNNKHTEGIYFQFQLKGLGGIGGPIDGILRDSIPGYEQREKHYE